MNRDRARSREYSRRPEVKARYRQRLLDQKRCLPRLCLDCPIDIRERHGRAKRCEECAAKRIRESNRRVTRKRKRKGYCNWCSEVPSMRGMSLCSECSDVLSAERDRVTVNIGYNRW